MRWFMSQLSQCTSLVIQSACMSVFSERYGNNLPQVIAANEPSNCEDLLQAGQEIEVYFNKST